jgi:protein phosphatase
VGDRFLLCSDGLPVAVGDEEIMQVLAEVKDPAEAVLKLIELAISGGGPDNITCIVADVIDTRQSSLKPTREPVLAGAAASGASAVGHKTMEFPRPVDGMGGLTQLGTLPDRHDLLPSTILPPTGPASGSQPGPRTRPGEALRGTDAAEASDADEDVRLAGGSGRSGGTPPGGLPIARRAQPRRRRLPVMTAVLAAFVLLIAGGLFVGHEYVQSQYYVGTQNGKVAIFRGLNQTLFGISLSSLYQSTGVPLSGLPVMDRHSVNTATPGSLAIADRLVANVSRDYQTCQRAYARFAAWQASRGRRITYRRHGHLITKYVKPPHPRIPSMCPAQPAAS